jgi:hypothetical protein
MSSASSNNRPTVGSTLVEERYMAAQAGASRCITLEAAQELGGDSVSATDHGDTP